MGGRGVRKRRLREASAVPELEPLEIVWSSFDVVLVAVLLEEKILVTPERWDSFRAGDDPTDEFRGAAELCVKLRWAVVSEQLVHCSVARDNLKLLVEVVLVVVGPAVGVVGLSLNHERPVRSALLVAS